MGVTGYGGVSSGAHSPHRAHAGGGARRHVHGLVQLRQGQEEPHQADQALRGQTADRGVRAPPATRPLRLRG